jgi:hypothetical protein
MHAIRKHQTTTMVERPLSMNRGVPLLTRYLVV